MTREQAQQLVKLLLADLDDRPGFEGILADSRAEDLEDLEDAWTEIVFEHGA